MEAKKKKLQLRKETMAMLDDPQMHGINGGGPTGPTVIGPPGSPGTTCPATCAATCAVTCAANCTATMNFTCEGFTCQTGGACAANSRQTCGTCGATCGPKCGTVASGPSGVGDDTNTDTRNCGFTGGGGVQPPGGGITC